MQRSPAEDHQHGEQGGQEASNLETKRAAPGVFHSQGSRCSVQGPRRGGLANIIQVRQELQSFIAYINLEVEVDNRCLDDSVEMCRETAALMLADYFADAATLHHVIPVVRKRLLETGEPSEEVRLAFLNLMIAIAGNDKNREDLKLSMDDIREIAMAAVQADNDEGYTGWGKILF